MKTILIIITLIYLVPCLAFLLVHFRNWNKAFAKIRWWTVIYPLGVFGLTEFVMFFPAWWTWKIPILKWVFWIWMDDSRIRNENAKLPKNKYAEDYYIYLNGEHETIWSAYQWHIRNRVWNLDSLFAPKKGERKIVEIIYDDLVMNGYHVDQSQSWIPMARLKYWNDGVEGSNVNKGAFISKRYSIFGKGYVWEKIGKRLTFRYSFLKSFLGLWWNFQSGENANRNAFTMKIKRKKQWK